ncbi:radical SAM protein, partial [Archaeoglobales archaeon]
MQAEINDYDFPPYRPPSEAGSYLVRVIRGCTWNRCLFCGMYKDIKFEARETKEVLKDIDRLTEIFGILKTAFLGDSNPLVHKDIVEIVSYLKSKHPRISRITAYARAKTIARMREEKLETLKDAGLTRLHVGLESGDDGVLKLIRKGATSDDMVNAGLKAKKYFELSFYVILGLGGVEMQEQHVKNTAKVINEVKPDFVRIRTLTIGHNTEMQRMVENGIITPLTPLQQLNELKKLIESINVETYLTCDHVSNLLVLDAARWFNRILFSGVEGHLPEEKERML